MPRFLDFLWSPSESFPLVPVTTATKGQYLGISIETDANGLQMELIKLYGNIRERQVRSRYPIEVI